MAEEGKIAWLTDEIKRTILEEKDLQNNSNDKYVGRGEVREKCEE